jgi:hypothetical protein
MENLIISKSYSFGSVQTIIYSDDLHAEINKNSSPDNAERLFLSINKPEYVGKFGREVGFATLSQYEKDKSEGRLFSENQKAESITIVGESRNSHIEKLFHVESFDFGQNNARLMKNSRGFFLAIDSNGQIVGGREYAIKISDAQSMKLQKLQGDLQKEYISTLSEI